MQRSDFFFELPDELIARYPAAERTASRLLCLDGRDGSIAHRQFTDLEQLLEPGDLLVFNDTRVIPARLFGFKDSGGRIEILIERLLDEQRALAHIRASKAPKPGTTLNLCRDYESSITAQAEVLGRQGALFELSFHGSSALEILQAIGHMPLPPYIDRADEQFDQQRYQTVYARNAGAVAAPTAGLHFDEALLSRLQARGVELGYVTLHVGAGTFQPVRVDDIREHQMHSEYLEVSEALCEQVRATRARGGRVIAVGTTSVRCLESASDGDTIRPYCGDTQIFIYPGYRFRCVDRLITNFHLPESTLIMLVSAMAGQDAVLNAYRCAVAERYRFFSYGDAMFVTPTLNSLQAEKEQ